MTKFKYENIKLKKKCDAALAQHLNYTIKSSKCHQNLMPFKTIADAKFQKSATIIPIRIFYRRFDTKNSYNLYNQSLHKQGLAQQQ
jgi:hypothetical protein